MGKVEKADPALEIRRDIKRKIEVRLATLGVSSKQALCRRIGVDFSPQVLNGWLHADDVKVSSLQRIAAALQLPVGQVGLLLQEGTPAELLVPPAVVPELKKRGRKSAQPTEGAGVTA